MEFKHCNHLVDRSRRIALYEPGFTSLVHAAYPTLAEAKKDYDIPEDIEFEQGLGELFIAVPYSARKHNKEGAKMERYVAGYGIVKVQLIIADKLPMDAEYLGADETYFYYKMDDKFYAVI